MFSVGVVYEMDTNEVKQILYKLGADLCGVAPTERFCEAPVGFHPCDVFYYPTSSGSRRVNMYFKRIFSHLKC